MDLLSTNLSRWDLAVTFLFGAQLLGLTAACAVRICLGTPQQGLCQWLFNGSLGLIAGMTIAAANMSPGNWVSCGITLSLMVLIATSDFRRRVPRNSA